MDLNNHHSFDREVADVFNPSSDCSNNNNNLISGTNFDFENDNFNNSSSNPIEASSDAIDEFTSTDILTLNSETQNQLKIPPENTNDSSNSKITKNGINSTKSSSHSSSFSSPLTKNNITANYVKICSRCNRAQVQHIIQNLTCSRFIGSDSVSSLSPNVQDWLANNTILRQSLQWQHQQKQEKMQLDSTRKNNKNKKPDNNTIQTDLEKNMGNPIPGKGVINNNNGNNSNFQHPASSIPHFLNFKGTFKIFIDFLVCYIDTRKLVSKGHISRELDDYFLSFVNNMT